MMAIKWRGIVAYHNRSNLFIADPLTFYPHAFFGRIGNSRLTGLSEVFGDPFRRAVDKDHR